MIMEINIRCNKEENNYIKTFIEFYLVRCCSNEKIVEIECPDIKNSHRAPDYLVLKPQKYVIEVKRVFDKKELENLIQISHNIRRLREKLRSRDLRWLHGLYIIETPPNLRIKKGQEDNVIDSILTAIKEDRSSVTIHKIGTFEFRKISNEGSDILNIGPKPKAGWLDPQDTIYRNVDLNIANEQLGAMRESKIKRKILLLVNKYNLGGERHFIGALCNNYENLKKYENIDEIWLQMENYVHAGKFSHILLYKRDFIANYEKKKILTQEDDINLFIKWFPELVQLGDEHKEKVFHIIKSLLKHKKPHDIFSEKNSRIEIVRFYNWLYEKKRFNDIIWIIEKFLDDPDPPEPSINERVDNYHNYHQEIIEGKDPLIITTVLGNLAWAVQKITVNKKYIVKALNYTEKLLNHKNFYVKLQAIVPLIEIAKRRQWLSGYGKRPRRGKYKEFHKLTFGLLKLLREYPTCKAIAKWLCHVFAYYKDLSTREALQVLNTLKISEEAAGLFVYFGIYRQNHYKDQPIKFNGRRLEKELENMLKNTEHEYQQLRSNIVWHLWKIITGDKNEFNTIKPYIDLILKKQPYQPILYKNIEDIIEECIKVNPEVCIQWYESMLSNIIEFVEKRKDSHVYERIWLMHTEEIIKSIAEVKPNYLLKIVNKLIYLWKKGVYIGNPKEIFESFKLVKDLTRQVEIRKTFKNYYKEMKKMNPKLKEIDWK